MTARKHLGRGLESVSHLFLSRHRPSPPEAPSEQAAPASAVETGEPGPYLFVTSGADVIGRAVVACNVALELARRGHATAVVDADASQPNLRLLMGALLESAPMPVRLAVDESHELALFDSLEAAGRADEAWDYVVVNAPSALFGPAGPPRAAARVLLVVSPETPELIRAYALLKRTAQWHSRLQLGIVVSGVDAPDAARALFNQFLDLLGRRLNVLPAYCGYLGEHEAIGRSVLRRTPAVLGSEASALVEQLRAIAAAVACEFEPGGSGRNR
jgi:MinD-like ATPase involved in chromosome partitioning or flagellar assembly